MGLPLQGIPCQHRFKVRFRVTVMCPEGSKNPTIRDFGSLARVITVQVLGKYMTIRYLDP